MLSEQPPHHLPSALEEQSAFISFLPEVTRLSTFRLVVLILDISGDIRHPSVVVIIVIEIILLK